MINLDQLFTNAPTVELIEPLNATSKYLRSLRLLLRDTATGALTELTIEADMLALPEQAILVLSVMEVDPPRVTVGHGEYVDDGQSHVVDEPEPPAEWLVTPHGEHVDLRAPEGQLF